MGGRLFPSGISCGGGGRAFPYVPPHRSFRSPVTCILNLGQPHRLAIGTLWAWWGWGYLRSSKMGDLVEGRKWHPGLFRVRFVFFRGIRSSCLFCICGVLLGLQGRGADLGEGHDGGLRGGH